MTKRRKNVKRMMNKVEILVILENLTAKRARVTGERQRKTKAIWHLSRERPIIREYFAVAKPV